jgi:hypothetical protein
MLRMHKQGEKIRWTSQKHWKQSLTHWRCTNKEKRSGGLHRSTENSHLQAEDAHTTRKDQVDFTEALKTVTYILRVHRQGEKFRWTSQKHWNSHLHPEGAQTRRKDQVDFTEALKTVTYILRMYRQGESSAGVHGSPKAPTFMYCIHMCTLLSANGLYM